MNVSAKFFGLTLFFVCLALFKPLKAHAQIDVFDFETPEQEQRYRQLSNDFRCPMCQNANLSSSPGGVASDLRREIYRMIMEGQTDTQIEEFMLARYGDFILYRPRLTAQTLLLWFGPLMFLLAGVWVARNIIRNSGVKKTNHSQSEANAPINQDTYAVTDVVISDDERKRLNRLLADHDDSAHNQDNTGR
jgi:cytochrome c-type biogenesis protein CcmH